jgi:hypothetical protein
MKRLAVWLFVMVTCFGACHLYAAPSKFDSAGRAIGFLIRQADRHNWPRWVVWILVVGALLCFVGWIVEYFGDREKKDSSAEKGKP